MILLVIRGSEVTRITSFLPLCWFTISATAMAPEPPGLLTTVTGWPTTLCALMAWSAARAVVSQPLPGPAPAIHATLPFGAHRAGPPPPPGPPPHRPDASPFGAPCAETPSALARSPAPAATRPAATRTVGR